MPATINVRYLTRYMLQNVSYSPKSIFRYLTYHDMSCHKINKCPVSYLEMLGTYPMAGIHETVRYQFTSEQSDW